MKELTLQQQQQGLERYFQQCLSCEPGTDLAIALHDYIEYIENHEELDFLIANKLQIQPKKILAERENLSKKAMKEVDEVYDLLVKELPKKAKPDEVFKSFMDITYSDLKEEKVRTSRGMLEGCADALEAGIQTIFEKYDEKLVADYVQTDKLRDGRVWITKVTVSKSLERMRELKDQFDRSEEVTPWGALLSLSMTRNWNRLTTNSNGSTLTEKTTPTLTISTI